MLIELLFTVCLLSSPDQCKHETIVSDQVTKQQCQSQAQIAIAEWLNQHSNYSWKAKEGYHCSELGQGFGSGRKEMDI